MPPADQAELRGQVARLFFMQDRDDYKSEVIKRCCRIPWKTPHLHGAAAREAG